MHLLAPCLAVRDEDDARTRARNYRSSMDACPFCWRVYFEVHAREMERQFVQ